MNTIRIATDFTTAPGPRYISEGKNSGEQFRKDILLPRLQAACAGGYMLVVDLDGTAGYGTSFLEESFGGLIREDGFSLSSIDATMEIVSDEEPELLTEIREYMQEAENQRKQGRHE